MTLLPAIPTKGGVVDSATLAKIEAEVARRVPTITEIPLLDEWRSRAAALTAYLRGRELQRPMMGAQRRVEARIGQLLPPAEETQRAGVPLGHGLKVIAPDDRVDFRILARAFDNAANISGEEWRKSRRALVMLIRKRLRIDPVSPEPDGRFGIILADPPWKYDSMQVEGGVEHGKRYQYPTMELSEICAKKDDLAPHISDKAVLFLWATVARLPDAFEVMKAWGFTYKTCAIWDKVQRGGIGYYFMGRHELLLVGNKGGYPRPDADHRPESIFAEKKRGHSRKPEAAYRLIESMYPKETRRLELFARRSRVGWETMFSPEICPNTTLDD